MDEPTGPAPPQHGPGQPIPQICCDCGFLTYEPVKVGEAWAAAGSGRDVYACPRHAPRYLVGGAP